MKWTRWLARRRKLVGAVFVLLLVVAALPATGQVEEKGSYRLGLYLERRDGDHDGEVLNAATDAFIAAHRFTLAARSQLDAVFTEKNLQEFLGGRANHKLADVLDLDFLGVVGYTFEASRRSLGSDTAGWIIDVRLVDMKTAAFQGIVTSNRPGRTASSPREAGQLLYQSIREAFPLMGYVVRVQGKEVIVDLGKEAGLQKGDILEVVQVGRPIRHPVKDSMVSVPPEVIGELKVLATAVGSAACKIKSGRGEIRDTQLVRLKSGTSLTLRWILRLQNIEKAPG